MSAAEVAGSSEPFVEQEVDYAALVPDAGHDAAEAPAEQEEEPNAAEEAPAEPPAAEEPAKTAPPAPAWEPKWASLDEAKLEDVPEPHRPMVGKLLDMAKAGWASKEQAIRGEVDGAKALMEDAKNGFVDLVGKLDAATGADGKMKVLAAHVEGANQALNDAATENSQLAMQVFTLRNEPMLKALTPQARDALGKAFEAPNFWDRFEGANGVEKMEDALRFVTYRHGIQAPAPVAAPAPPAAPVNPQAKKQALVSSGGPATSRRLTSEMSLDEAIKAAIEQAGGDLKP